MSSSSSSLSLFSKETLTSDISKLLIRHDDRDNKVLQGTTKMDTYEYDDESFVDGRGASVNGNNSKRRVVNVYSTTTLPISGTYRDGIWVSSVLIQLIALSEQSQWLLLVMNQQQK